MAEQQYYGTGKRKTSVARVYVRPGSGRMIINRKPCEEYFPGQTEQITIKKPLVLAGAEDKYDVLVNVRGGGVTGQVEAIRHGLSRALTLVPQEEYRGLLKRAGFLTRDSRMVERKKYGRPGARKRYQYSKR